MVSLPGRTEVSSEVSKRGGEFRRGEAVEGGGDRAGVFGVVAGDADGERRTGVVEGIAVEGAFGGVEGGVGGEDGGEGRRDRWGEGDGGGGGAPALDIEDGDELLDLLLGALASGGGDFLEEVVGGIRREFAGSVVDLSREASFEEREAVAVEDGDGAVKNGGGDCDGPAGVVAEAEGDRFLNHDLWFPIPSELRGAYSPGEGSVGITTRARGQGGWG